MNRCPEKLLRNVNLTLDGYAETHKSDAAFCRDIKTLAPVSLQEAILSGDEAFFAEVNSVLNVITTIVLHPHIVNRRESVIVRAEESHGLTPEMFLDTVRDRRLWKDKRGVMTPAEVYYHRNVDELNNYENRFIVFLIDKLGERLSDYGNFYGDLIGKMGKNGAAVKEGSPLERILLRQGTLTSKLKRIKRTDFYREVAGNGTALSHVEATNVLKHNRAYHFCLRFFRKTFTETEKGVKPADLAPYFYTRMLLALDAVGFRPLPSKESGTGVLRPFTFGSDDFTVRLASTPARDGMVVTVTSADPLQSPAENILLFDGTDGFEGAAASFGALGREHADAVGIWDLATLAREKAPVLWNVGGSTETELLCRYLTEKTLLFPAAQRVYERRCPVCGKKDPAAVGPNHYCRSCGSEYSFVGGSLWLRNKGKS